MQLRGGHSPGHNACHKQPRRGPCRPHPLQAHRDLHLRVMHGSDALGSHCTASAQVLQSGRASGAAAQDPAEWHLVHTTYQLLQPGSRLAPQGRALRKWGASALLSPNDREVALRHFGTLQGWQGSSTCLVRGLTVWMGPMMLLLLLTPLIQCLQTADAIAPHK